MAKSLNPYSTSGSTEYNENINKYMMDLGQGSANVPLPQENAIGPTQTTQTNPADGMSVTTGETASNIDKTVPEVYGAGTGTINDVTDNSTINYDTDENPNLYTA